jgi:hypothetical protein
LIRQGGPRPRPGIGGRPKIAAAAGQVALTRAGGEQVGLGIEPLEARRRAELVRLVGVLGALAVAAPPDWLAAHGIEWHRGTSGVRHGGLAQFTTPS